MGQYYRPIFLNPTSFSNDSSNKNKIIGYIAPHDFWEGAKLMEHSYVGNIMCSLVEGLISKDGDGNSPLSGKFANCPFVWAGDYADPEKYKFKKESSNLYDISYENEKLHIKVDDVELLKANKRYIINETKKVYFDKERLLKWLDEPQIHPLPLLCCEGNGRGGGDYYCKGDEPIGLWARDCISASNTRPSEEYEEEYYHFYYR